jgi:putative ABC transport system permease protein
MWSDLSLSLRLTRRDWRAGELRLLLISLVVAVAAVASVGFFVQRMKLALQAQAASLIGADRVLASDQPLDDQWQRQALAQGLRAARTVSFAGMALAGERAQLASVKAVSPGYPLRGQLRVADRLQGGDQPTSDVPGPDSVWVDPQLLASLGVRLGDRISLGERSFRIERLITLEPDRGSGFINFAPRAMIALDALDATGLVQPASRVTWRLLVSGEPAAMDRWVETVRTQLQRGQRLESLDNARPELRITLQRSEKFLSLVGLLSALLAAVAIALATRRFVGRHLDGCAILRALGISQGRLTRLLAAELLILALAGSVLGCAAGWGLHLLIVAAIGSLLQMPLPLPGPLPAVQAAAAGLILLLGFAAGPFLRLSGVSALKVLRRDLGGPGVSSWVAVVSGLFAFGLLLTWFAEDVRLAGIAAAGFAGAAAVFALVAAGVLWSLVPLRHWLGRVGAHPALRLALAAGVRRRSATVVQTVALSVGLMALLLLTLVRSDLIDSWRAGALADAPNRFLVNIQPQQREAVEQALDQIKASSGQTQSFYPMVRGRLVSINDRAVSSADFADESAKRLVDREFNLSYADSEPVYNRTVAGRWIEPHAAEVSVESGIARTLGLAIGDRLGFEVAGEPVSATVVGLRKLAWDSMQVNFFMMLSTDLLKDKPQTLITAYRAAEGAGGAAGAQDSALIRRFPNLTVFDTTQLIEQVRTIFDQVSAAVEVLFVLTLAAGLVVLYAALASSRDERIVEAALMRALGASGRLLLRSQLGELALTGALAGLMAAGGALLTGMVLARQVFQFDYHPYWIGLPAGMVMGVLAAVLAGWIGVRDVLRAAPITTLRAV